MFGFRFVPDDSNFNFIALRKLAFALSLILIIGSVSLTAKNGLNFGIDFIGGTAIEIRTPEMPDLELMRRDLNQLSLGAISIQEFGRPDDLLIRVPQQAESADQKVAYKKCVEKAQKSPKSDLVCLTVQQQAIETVRGSLNGMFTESAVDYRRTEFVGPQVGKELKMKGLYAIIFSLIGILAYIWFRFEWQFGVAAIVALAHDAIATIGLFAFTQMEFNLSTVAAILMIAGYSINDTVVVFDRIRENLRKYKKKLLPELFNFSINQTLARTLMTSITTLLALLALYAFGGEVIRGFVVALLFGIIIGTYSSIFVASPVLLLMNVRGGKGKQPELAQEGA